MKPLPMSPTRSFGFAISEILVDDQAGVESPSEEVDHVLHGGYGHAFGRLLGDAGDVRRQDNLITSKQGMVRRRRLIIEHVEPSGGDAAPAQGSSERAFIDNAATRGVDEDRARLEEGELLSANQRLLGLRHVEGDDV